MAEFTVQCSEGTHAWFKARCQRLEICNNFIFEIGFFKCEVR